MYGLCLYWYVLLDLFIHSSAKRCWPVLLAPLCSVTCIHMKLGHALLLLLSTRGLMPSLAKVCTSGWQNGQLRWPTRPTYSNLTGLTFCVVRCSLRRLSWSDRGRSSTKHASGQNQWTPAMVHLPFFGWHFGRSQGQASLKSHLSDILWLRWKSLKDWVACPLQLPTMGNGQP